MPNEGREPSVSLPPPPAATIVEVLYPAARGTIGLRGNHAPLSWDHTHLPEAVDGDRHMFRVHVPPNDILELKVVRNDDEAWAGGRNYAVHAGDHLRIEPYFEAASGRLEQAQKLEVGDEQLVFDVHLPPSYAEQESKRYPVLYVLDGQSLWSTSEDPFGIWHLDSTIDALNDLDAIDEMIVVGVHASERRLERLSPVADPEHGGGEGARFLAAIVDALRPHVDGRYRTMTGRDHTAIMGSSMGGLFAFFAAWSRPDVFGKAACLSSSFWWGNRWAVRTVQEKTPPSPRPVFYIDSGAARNGLDRDAHARDGFHHTRSMFRALTSQGYEPGIDLHRLVFQGAGHDAGAWSERVGIPLQLLFPREPVKPRVR